LICLIDNDHRSGVPPIIRSLLEASVEFTNLHNEATYGYHMEASHIDQWNKVLKEANTQANPYLSEIAKVPNLESLIQSNEEKLANLASKGYRPLNIFQRFEKADMIPEYKSMYNFLSNDSHCNIRALIDRHLEIKENDYEVVFYKDVPLEDFLSYIDISACILINASTQIHEIFKSDSLKVFDKYSDQLGSIRGTYT